MTLFNGKRMLAAGLALGLNAMTAQAALFDRGGGLLYDDVLKVTWLQDANYAKTSGYDVDGLMDLVSAKTWVDNLVYGGYSDWRLAGNKPVNGVSFNFNYSSNGSTDVGYNIISVNAELSYMYYVNLGLVGSVSPSGVFQTSTYPYPPSLVNNLQPYAYWSGSEPTSNPNNAWMFHFWGGNQNDWNPRVNTYYSWAVRDGDVAAVPVPGAVWLFGTGLVGLLGLKRRGNSA